MIRLDADRPATFCDGLSRRDFLHAGAIVAARPHLAEPSAREGRGNEGRRRELHHAVPGRRAESDRHLGPEAERPGRGPRAVRPDQDERRRHADQRDLPADGEARGQVLAGPQRVPHRDRGPRHRPPDDADRPAVHRRRRTPARRLRARLPEGRARRTAGARPPAAADRPHRRQPAARPDRRLPRQAARPVRPERRPERARLQGARPAAAGVHQRDPRRTPPEAARRGGRRDGSVREERRGQAARRQLQARLQADVERRRPARRSPWRRNRTRRRTATAARASGSPA